MQLLVAGAKRVDAGKTTLAAGLIAATGAVGFKPRAGNDFWFDHDDCRAALDQGRLFGKDARILADVSPGTLPPEAINPIHRLWRPAPGPKTGMLGQANREFLLEWVGDEYVVNGTVELPAAVRDALDLESATIVDSVDALNRVTERRHLPAQRDLLVDLRTTDQAVVESYGDVAQPLDLEPDAVAVVEPRQARLYEGRRYARACEVAPHGRRDGTLEQRVDAVVDLLEPAARVPLTPIPADHRSDASRIAETYDAAINGLLDLARS